MVLASLFPKVLGQSIPPHLQIQVSVCSEEAESGDGIISCFIYNGRSVGNQCWRHTRKDLLTLTPGLQGRLPVFHYLTCF